MFERVQDETTNMDTEDKTLIDPCVIAMREGTDEAQKVIRREGQIWHAVFKKRDVSKAEEMQAVEADYMAKFFL